MFIYSVLKILGSRKKNLKKKDQIFYFFSVLNLIIVAYVLRHFQLTFLVALIQFPPLINEYFNQKFSSPNLQKGLVEKRPKGKWFFRRLLVSHTHSSIQSPIAFLLCLFCFCFCVCGCSLFVPK